MNQNMQEKFEATIAGMYGGEEMPENILDRVDALSDKEKKELAKAIHDYSGGIPVEERELLLAQSDLHQAWEHIDHVPELQEVLGIVNSYQDKLRTKLGDAKATLVSDISLATLQATGENLFLLGWRLGRNRNWMAELPRE